MNAAAVLLGRLLIAALFVLEGWSKLQGYSAAASYMQAFGVPAALLPAVIALELGGGLLLALGWQTRLAALGLAVFCVLAAVLFHADFANRTQLIQFEKDLAIAGGLLVLAACGPGRYSLDALRAAAPQAGR